MWQYILDPETTHLWETLMFHVFQEHFDKEHIVEYWLKWLINL